MALVLCFFSSTGLNGMNEALVSNKLFQRLVVVFPHCIPLWIKIRMIAG